VEAPTHQQCIFKVVAPAKEDSTQWHVKASFRADNNAIKSTIILKYSSKVAAPV
jgi:hypothetical protein